MSPLTIIGGYGKVAMLATPLLLDADHIVRSVIRKEEQIADIEALGAIPVVSDFATLNDEDLGNLLAGSDATICSVGAGAVAAKRRTWAVDRDAAIRVMDATE